MTLRMAARPVDNQRVARLLIAWLDGDRLAFDALMSEVENDPTGPIRIIGGLTDYTCYLLNEFLPMVDLDPKQAIREYLLGLAREDDGG